MKEILQYENQRSLAYLLVNDNVAMDKIQSFLDEFMDERNNEAFIFVAYHVTRDVIVLHRKPIAKGIGFDSAVKMIKVDIESGDLCADDASLKKMLGNPQVTTAKILLDYIESEGY